MTRYAAASCPEPLTLLGQRLRPLALGHLLWLYRLGSPFVTPATQLIEEELIGRTGSASQLSTPPLSTPGKGDILTAVILCTQPGRDAGTLLFGHWLRLRLLGWRCRKLTPVQWQERILTFEEHLRTETECPEFFSKSRRNSEDSAMAWLHSIKILLMSRLHVSPQAALDYPIRLAIEDTLAILHMEGALTLAGRGETSLLTAAKAMETERNGIARNN